MINTELHYAQLFIWYISYVRPHMLDNLMGAVVYCHAVRCILCILQYCSEVLNHWVRMLSITVVVGSHKFRHCTWLDAQGGSQISTGRVHYACGSAVLPTLSDGFMIELSALEEVKGTLKVDCIWQAVEIVIGGIPTVFEVCFMCLIMSLSGILLEGAIWMNLFDPIRHQVDCRKVHGGIYIRKRHFSQWKPPGVSERMWSVNSDASISGEYQTLGGHSCWPPE